MKIDIIFPILNEEKRLKTGIMKTIEYLKKSRYQDYCLTIVDNGSTDRTEEIAIELCKMNDKIKYLKIREKGVGVAFRAGIENTYFEIVGYMDIDLSTDISTLDEVYKIFLENKNIDIINASRNMKNSKIEGRPLKRTIPSKVLKKIINIVLKTKLTDYMCGFKFFRRNKLMKIMKKTSGEKGWFYCAELLIYGEWNKYGIYELPIRWIDEREDSKVDSQIFKLTKNYLIQIFKLLKKRRKI